MYVRGENYVENVLKFVLCRKISKKYLDMHSEIKLPGENSFFQH